MGVTRAGKWCLLYGCRLGTGIPQKHLARVCTSNDEVGMEWGELCREDIGLSVEYVFRAVVHVQIPDLDEAVWIVWSGGILGVRRKDELGELGRMSAGRAMAILGH